MGTKFLKAVGVLPVELLTYQVSMASAANGQDSSINTLDVILGWVNNAISPLISLFYIFFKLNMSGYADTSKL